MSIASFTTTAPDAKIMSHANTRPSSISTTSSGTRLVKHTHTSSGVLSPPPVLCRNTVTSQTNYVILFMPRRLQRVEKREKCTEMMETTAMVVA